MHENRPPLANFRTILFATDFSHAANNTFRVACSLAQEGATRLVALHVAELPTTLEQSAYGELGMPLFFPDEENTRKDMILRQLRDLYVPSMPVEVEYRVTQGTAAEEILAVANEIGSGLIVMGTHGRHGLKRLLMGSVAEAVMRRANCACLTVRSSSPGSAELHPMMRPFQRILHPTDFSQHSEVALQVARSLARDHGARLVLLHAVLPEFLPAPVSEVLLDLEIGHDGLEEVRSRATGSDLKYPVESHLRRGKPATEILRVASTSQCDLIVMGSHGRSGVSRLVMGSVTEEVMREAGCPVLTVKASMHSAVNEGQTVESTRS